MLKVCPIPNGVADSAETAFREEGHRQGYAFEDGDAGAHAIALGNYFRADLPSGKTLVHPLRPGQSFNMQFGR